MATVVSSAEMGGGEHGIVSNVPAPGGPMRIIRTVSAAVGFSPFMLRSILVILSCNWLTKSLRPVTSCNVGAMANCVMCCFCGERKALQRDQERAEERDVDVRGRGRVYGVESGGADDDTGEWEFLIGHWES